MCLIPRRSGKKFAGWCMLIACVSCLTQHAAMAARCFSPCHGRSLFRLHPHFSPLTLLQIAIQRGGTLCSLRSFCIQLRDHQLQLSLEIKQVLLSSLATWET